MIKKIIIVILVLVVVLVIVVAVQPADFHVSRTATIPAPVDAVFPHVNDLHQWQEWSPWAKMDPNAKMTYSGPQAGVGAAFTWAGNMNVGEGTMTISESKANEQIKFNLEFLKPFKGNSTAEFTFKPEADHTVVTWSMDGKKNFITKAMGLFMSCDKMIGGEFEKGLASLAGVVKAAPKQETTTTAP